MKSSTKLQSENVIIESPMSYTGVTKRLWPLTGRSNNKYVKWFVLVPCVLVLLYFAYSIITLWYVVFGILLIPFRMSRRRRIKRQVEDARHREMLDAIAAKK